ncbi:MAG: peptidoglycan DD-metalloendopeptidase family protein [Vampirovibrionales bacterium]|nr:peptidoglycan DD-metalloendopeptidase family protein [Vampirovibrionales bacterium]
MGMRPPLLTALVLRLQKTGTRARSFTSKSLFKAFVVLLAALLLDFGFLHPESFSADKPKNANLQELQRRRQNIQSKVNELTRKKREKQRQANIHNTNLVRNQRELEKKRRSRIYHIQNLENTKNRISYLDHKIDRTTGEAARLSEDAGKRLRAMYMGERLSVLQMILEAKDISTLLDRLYYKKRIVAQDKTLLNNLKLKIKELAELKNELASQKSILDHTIQSLRTQELEIARSAQVDRQLRDRYLKDASFYEKAERQMLSESNSIMNDIQRLSAGNKLNLDKDVATGSMIWPIRGRITSNFGSRFHPIHKKWTTHTGLDIAGPNRGAVKAADGGQVIFAGWKGGYGKCIMINHGKKNGANIVTLYGHLSSFNVGTGQYVTKGSTIAAEGSTGYSTGPHLHFEVRRNGAPVNPYSYLP